MARIRTTHQAFRTKVSIQGRLAAADMRRLEHACASALVMQPLRLGIDIRQVTEIDATAAALLARLKARGAVIWPELTGHHPVPPPENELRCRTPPRISGPAGRNRRETR